MIIHDQEASKVWCPFSSVVGFDRERMLKDPLPGFDIDWKPSTASFCLGSKCMAWRWVDDDSGTGYCGLAGKPRLKKPPSSFEPTSLP